MMWIEVLSRDGEVDARQRIDSDEARIGRAFDNDVVVADPHVAPNHLRIFRGEDGELVAEDLGTLNGLFAEYGAQRVQRLSLKGEPGIRIGRTVLRVHDAAHPVAAERLLTPPRAHARWAVILGALLCALILFLNWLNLTTEPSANVVLLPMMGLAIVLFGWAGLWGLLSRVFNGQAQYPLHLRIAITAAIAVVLWDLIAETLSYSFAWRGIADYAALGAWVILAATCWAHLAAVQPRHLRLEVGAMLALVIAGATMQYVSKSENREQVGQRATLGDLRPPVFRLAPASSAEEFFKDTEDARARVDKARLKDPPASGGLVDPD